MNAHPKFDNGDEPRLRRHAEAARDLIAEIGSDDETLTQDMVEGETGLLEAIGAALAEIDECEVMKVGLKEKEAAFAARRKRVEARMERIRGLIEQALVIADMKSLRLPSATLTVSQLPSKPLITDEAAIPVEFWKRPDPVLDRKALKDAFDNGDAIPGVTASNGTTSLKIRRL
ncbi:MAG: siphovirus Gp157 family protein [Celeribacter sp.]|jgi:hypothetical protein